MKFNKTLFDFWRTTNIAELNSGTETLISGEQIAIDVKWFFTELFLNV